MEPAERIGQYEHAEYKQIQNTAIHLIEKDPDVLMLKRDWGDLVLIFKGNTPEYLEEGRDLLLDAVRHAAAQTGYKLTIGMGSTKNQIADICQSFIEALAVIQNPYADDESGLNQTLEQVELPKVDKLAVGNYLRCGVQDKFDEFFNAHLLPLGETALKSSLIKNYIFMDVLMAAVELVNDLGGEVDSLVPELNSIEMITSNIKTMEHLREQTHKIFSSVLTFRDSQSQDQYKSLIRQAKEYIEHQFMNPELSLNEVAAEVNLSASHFSFVFSQASGQTFKEYLTEIRIKTARELLRMTGLRSADIGYRVGYNDPHYFSSVFKKHTGFSPIEFRSQI
jgi:two-component system response regulator YesN